MRQLPFRQAGSPPAGVRTGAVAVGMTVAGVGVLGAGGGGRGGVVRAALTVVGVGVAVGIVAGLLVQAVLINKTNKSVRIAKERGEIIAKSSLSSSCAG